MNNLSNNEKLLINNSKLFDKTYYTRLYLDNKDIDPIEHYLQIGWKKGYNPSESFSTNKYLKAYPDIANKKINPLVHFLKYGVTEGRFSYNVNSCIPELDIHQTIKPLISIIVASYNYQDLIKETLNSIINQTYKNYEVIIIDDGSKDNSLNVIREYTENIPNFHLFTHTNNSNRGLPETIKLGIEKSKGKYIAFCESDDHWHPNHLEEKVKIINKYANVNIISNNLILFGDELTINDRKKNINSLCNFLSEGGNKIDIKFNRHLNYIPTFSVVMIKTEIIRKLNFESPIPAWIDFWLYRQILKDNILFYTPKELTFWRMHNSYNGIVNSQKHFVNKETFIEQSDSIIGSKYCGDYDYTYIKRDVIKSKLQFIKVVKIINTLCKKEPYLKNYLLYLKLFWHRLLHRY